jgi:hypothetical protein
VKEGKAFYGYPLREDQIRFDTGNFEGYVEAFRYFSEKANPNLTKQ